MPESDFRLTESDFPASLRRFYVSMRQNRVSVRRPFGLVCHFGLVPPAFPQPQTPPAGARGGPGPTTYTSHIKKNALPLRKIEKNGTRVNECGITDNETVSPKPSSPFRAPCHSNQEPYNPHCKSVAPLRSAAITASCRATSSSTSSDSISASGSWTLKLVCVTPSTRIAACSSISPTILPP